MLQRKYTRKALFLIDHSMGLHRLTLHVDTFEGFSSSSIVRIELSTTIDDDSCHVHQLMIVPLVGSYHTENGRMILQQLTRSSIARGVSDPSLGKMSPYLIDD